MTLLLDVLIISKRECKTGSRVTLLLIIMSFVLVSCSQSNIGQSITGGSLTKSEIAVALSMKDAPSSVMTIMGVLSRNGYDTLTQAFVQSGDSATCKFTNVAIGTWHLSVNAYGASDTLLYTGSTDVQVNPGRVTPVELTLNPATGSISVTVTWGTPDTSSTDMALEFDGSTGYVVFPSAAVLHPQNCTVQFKVWFDTTGPGPFALLGPTSADLYTTAEGYELYEENGSMGFAVAIQPNLGEPVVHAFNVPYHKWVYLTGTYDGHFLSLYIDGQLMATAAWSAPIWYGQHGFSIGKMYHSDIFPGVFYFKGAIDDLRIWNYAMTQSEIDSTMNEPVSGNTPGLIGDWDFNQNASDVVAYDRTGNGDNGQLIGGVKFVPVSSLPVQQ